MYSVTFFKMEILNKAHICNAYIWEAEAGGL